MTRAQIVRQISHETSRQGFLGLWLITRLTKDQRALRLQGKVKRRSVGRSFK